MDKYECSLPNFNYTSISTFTRLVTFWIKLKDIHDKKICINCSKAKDLDMSLFGALGLLLEVLKNNNNSISFTKVPGILVEKFVEYDFIKVGPNTKLDKSRNLSSNVFKYKGLSGDDKVLFGQYIEENIGHLPLHENTRRMLSKILTEIFLNVRMHARMNPAYNPFNDKEIFCSGYYNDMNNMITFTICNQGISFKENMLNKKNIDFEQECDYIALAVQQGISTKHSIPGGMGLYFLHNLIESSNGNLIVYSGKGCYELVSKIRVTISKFDYTFLFPGTLISVSFPISSLAKIPIQDIPVSASFSLNDFIL
jgi:hypothetical protein